MRIEEKRFNVGTDGTEENISDQYGGAANQVPGIHPVPAEQGKQTEAVVYKSLEKSKRLGT